MRFKYLLIPMILLLAANCFAAEREKSVSGVFARDAEGITAKFMLKNSRTLDVSFGSQSTGDSDYQFNYGYLIYKYDFIKVAEGRRQLNFGGGDQNITASEHAAKNKDHIFGLRFPVGNEYLFWKSSSDAFLEFLPALSSTPDSKFQFGGGIGIKFFF